jgi:hypothetical protein
MKLSAKQTATLTALLPGERGAYPGLHLGTLESLERRGLAASRAGAGSIFSPQTGIKWRLTLAGRAIINERKTGDDDAQVTHA